jgi:hypothetical protein
MLRFIRLIVVSAEFTIYSSTLIFVKFVADISLQLEPRRHTPDLTLLSNSFLWLSFIIGVKFLFKVGVEESIRNAQRISRDHG